MHIAIIGNGISGITAARFLRKLSDHKITVISAESDYFFSRTALMYIYMGHMRLQDTQPYEDWFWEKNRIDLKRGYVETVDPQNKTLSFKDGEQLSYDKLIIASGSESNKFGWPGQDLDGVHGMYTLQDLEAMERHSTGLKRAVIVGGGLIGIEMAEMFHSRHIPVTFLVRENAYWNMVLPKEESAMIGRHILENGIELKFETELKEIVDDGNGKACAIITNKGERIECGFVGLTAGVHPNTSFLKDSGIEMQRGILVNEMLETNNPDIYAIGDCAQLREPREGRRNIEAIWYTGKMMGETVAYNICDQPIAYNPGIWFNSAKFFEIEYQIYGTVLARAPESHKSLYWEHSEGRKAIRIVYDSDNNDTILGFHLMGIRYRHEVCEKWIHEKASVTTVLENLQLANFDPEFYKTYEADLIKKYNKTSGKQLTLKKKSGLDNVFRFLSKLKA
ncbi:MAG: NADPH-dependent 2,4-dienoyl-CoA reductase/sulfur reductase-like enzyme [Gammaproteobacteria bacterium]|jgi:NADPH-dependent 2,4-dienoyl-CoA reductase/sulfur reductase-like enzyme